MTSGAFHDIREYMAPKQMAKPDAERPSLTQVVQKMIQEPKPEKEAKPDAGGADTRSPPLPPPPEGYVTVV